MDLTVAELQRNCRLAENIAAHHHHRRTQRVKPLGVLAKGELVEMLV